MFDSRPLFSIPFAFLPNDCIVKANCSILGHRDKYSNYCRFSSFYSNCVLKVSEQKAEERKREIFTINIYNQNSTYRDSILGICIITAKQVEKFPGTDSIQSQISSKTSRGKKDSTK